MAVALFHNPVTAWVILFCGIGLTAAAWWLSSSSVQRRAEERFSFRASEIQHAIDDRMHVYEQLLWGGVGFFDAAGIPSRESFATYVSALELDEQWPGVQGLGFAVRVAPSERDRHVAQIRAEGFPEYDLKPEGERSEYTAIIYLEPFDWRNRRAFGFDMWSNEIRREAMERARRSGLASTSGVITLVQETKEDVQKGFLSYVPVYRTGASLESPEERVEALIGWLYVAFRMGDLMEGILAHQDSVIEYEIFDGDSIDPDSLLFDSDDRYSGTSIVESASRGETFVQKRTLRTGERDWTVVFSADAGAILGGEARQPLMIAAGGIVVDLLLFYVITSLALLQTRASKMADEMSAEAQAARYEVEVKAAELEEYAQSLERSNHDLKQFAYVASHDLQEPLRAVASFSALLKQEYSASFDARGNGWLGHMVDAAERMSALVRDLLDYSKVDLHEGEFEAVSLDDALDEALANLETAIEETGARVERTPLGTVDGDPGQITQLFQNLVGNAIKYRAEDRAPVVRISAEPAGRHVRFRITDNGIGIKPAYHQRVFEIFKRVGSRVKYPGTGIGLAICRRVVQQHGGEISIASEEGLGSTFSFTLLRKHPGRG